MNFAIFPCMYSLTSQIIYLLLLAIPVACISWTVTHEEVFREPREYCVKKSKNARKLLTRKFFFLFTCEYCFSHYIALFFIIFTGFKMLYDHWIGFLISFFSLVWIANIYMSLYNMIRLDMKTESIEAKIKEAELEESAEEENNKS